jgi:hypothetical protein
MSNKANLIPNLINTFNCDACNGGWVVGRKSELKSESIILIVCCGLLHIRWSFCLLNNPLHVDVESSENYFSRCHIVWEKSGCVNVKVNSFV